MKFNLKLLLFSPIVFFFLPAFTFKSILMQRVYMIYYIILYIVLAILFIFDWKYIVKRILKIVKYTPFLYFIFFIILMCINSLILSFLGITTILQTTRSIFMQIVLCIIPNIVYFIIIIPKYISFKNFIRLFMFLFWINLLVGFLAYIARYFDISFINAIFDFLANAKMLRGDENYNAAHYFLSGRLTGLYEEPGMLGSFIFFFLPFVYMISEYKFNILNNKKINLFIQKTIVPFSWGNILLTLSPMSLIFTSIITVIYFRNKIFNFVKNKFIILCFLLFLIVIIISKINLSETFIYRIINLLCNIHSFNDFVLVEESLATRIVGYINTFYIFLSHPFTGVGIGNIGAYVYNQYLQSPVPLTPEIVGLSKINIASGKNPHILSGFIYSLLAEHGIIITSIFLYFYFMILKRLNQFKKIYTNTINYQILISLQYSLICLSIEFVYDLYIVNQYLHLLIALSLIAIYETKFIVRRSFV